MADPEKGEGPGVEFTITLPADAIEMIENGLIPVFSESGGQPYVRA